MPREQRPNQIGVSFLMDKDDHKIALQKAKDLNMSLASYAIYCMLNSNFKITQK